VDTFTRQLEVQGYSRMVPVAEISDAKNDYNLNLPRYIDGSDAEDLQDITAHLRGGIPERDIDAFENYWQVMPSLRKALFSATAHAGYAQLSVPIAAVKSAIFDHSEFKAFNQTATKLFLTWVEKTKPKLMAFDHGDNPKALIETISEELLEFFGDAKLISIYDIYQHMMDYWAETMQDDCYLISADGWSAAAAPKLVIEDKGSKSKAKADFVVGKKKYQTELIPPALIIARYFSAEQAKIDELNLKIDAFDQQLEEMAEEHGGEDGLLEEAKNDKDKITKATVAARLKAIKGEKGVAEELSALQAYLAIVEQQSDANDELREAESALTEQGAAKYQKLNKQEINTLVVTDKWIATLSTAVQGELDRVSQTLTGRIHEIAERYEKPLPSLIDEVSELSNRVDAHLKKMVSSWK
jgi:type I restriction enzyme M protein